MGFYTRVSDNTGPPIILRFSSKLETLPQKILTVLFCFDFLFLFLFFYDNVAEKSSSCLQKRDAMKIK